MTLHEAIEKLLSLRKRPMSTQDIADGINGTGWYRKKDGSPIMAFQIHGRTKNYPHIFVCNGSSVALANWGKSKIEYSVQKKVQLKSTTSAAPNTKSSFPPISNSDTEILILGTMPGDRSIAAGEYYAHPRNRFWQVMSTITNNPLPNDYAEKNALLLKVKIGIWDVAHKAKRHGSLDSSITDEEPNDLKGFILKHTNLRVIAFNGSKAKGLFEKYFETSKHLNYISLPSSSPANTGISFQDLCREWLRILKR